MKKSLYIGLMSGTSMDGVDAVLAEFTDDTCQILHANTQPYPDSLLDDLRTLTQKPAHTSLTKVGQLHVQLAKEFADAVLRTIKKSGCEADQIEAIGCHGQTVWHAPDAETPFTIQLGDPGTLAVLTGIPVVADFRNADIAAGGQGAPLVPPFHRWMLGSSDTDRAIINIGGIANITVASANGNTTGFDTGPGNTLLDQWINKHQQQPYDSAGNWAASGTVDKALLNQLLKEQYFSQPAPKSTGPEYFNLNWLQHNLDALQSNAAAEDVQATLSELTAATIAATVKLNKGLLDVAICGGGSANDDLMSRIKRLLPDHNIQTTANWGLDPQWVEAAAFAWLARQRLHNKPSNLPAVTGATQQLSLGGLYLPGH